jgi:hypothetical protein
MLFYLLFISHFSLPTPSGFLLFSFFPCEISGSHGGEYEEVFWVVAPCSLVEVYRRFRVACCLHRPDDGGRKDLWNVSKLLPDYTVLQPRRQQS